MGTNIYAIYNECPQCKRYNEIHFGKWSVGWKFCFQSHDEITFVVKHAGNVSIVTNESKTMSIKSVSDWRDFIISSGARLQNEYGEPVDFEKEIAKIAEINQLPDRLSHLNYNGNTISGPFWRDGMYFKDNEGNEFAKHDFS